jgi:PPM family protein phosphatase
MQLSSKLQSYGISDIGLVRSNNEDVWDFMSQPPFFVLADGMGGHKAGEVAAKLAVESLCKALNEEVELDEEIPELLRSAISYANSCIYTLASEKEECSGMGTTLCCFLLHKDTLHYAHIGDSRIYRFRENQLEQLTQDHSLRRELIIKGELDAKGAQTFPYRNIITRALGTSPSVEPDIASTTILPNDIYFLCSDGLTDHLPNEEIAHLLKKMTSVEQATQLLVDAAKAKGGNDNITIVMVKVLP